MSEHTPLTEAERIERLLAEHEFDFKGVMVQRDESGKATGYTLACTCGFVYPPDPEVNHHRAHVADILAARTSTATADTGLRERVEAWDEGCEAGRLNEKAKWYWAAGNRAAMAANGIPVERPPIMPTNPYRAALDATAAPAADTGARDE